MMKINVTRNHLIAGKRYSPCECPVALALKAAGFQNVRVANGRIALNGIYTRMPQNVTRFINMFDMYGANYTEPFTFELT